MHLLGHSVRIVLNPGTPEAKTILNVPNYNFDYQRAYNLKAPVAIKSGEGSGQLYLQSGLGARAPHPAQRSAPLRHVG